MSSAATISTAGGRGRSYSQRLVPTADSENLPPSGLGGGGCKASSRAVLRRISAGPVLTLTTSRTQMQLRGSYGGAAAAASGAGARQFGLSDITNIADDRDRGMKNKLSTSQRFVRESSAVASQGNADNYSSSIPAPGLSLAAKNMGGASRLDARPPSRPVAPPPPAEGRVPQEALPPATMEIDSPEPKGANERRNPQECKEYEPEIMDVLFREEALYMPRHDYMATQTDINARMRAILIDWLIEVHLKYKLRRETLYLAVNLIDRYMAILPVSRRRLQLVGVVGMFVAAKFEQIHPPRVTEFVYITDNTYTKEDILSMECEMLSALKFEVAVPTQAQCMDYLLKPNQCNQKQEALVNYLLELALVDLRSIRHVPSMLVSASLLLSNEIMGRPAWPEKMEQVSRHSEAGLRGCAEELRGLLRAAASATLQAVRKKYSLPQYAVAKLPEVLAA